MTCDRSNGIRNLTLQETLLSACVNLSKCTYMWHQHWCLVGTLTSLLVFLDSLLVFRTNQELADSFDWDEGLQKIVAKYARLSYLFDQIGSAVCLGYWLNGYIFSTLPIHIILKLRVRARFLSEFLWGFAVRPYLLISLLFLLRNSLQVINDVEYANQDIRTYISSLLAKAKIEYADKGASHPNLVRMYNLQQQYHCCGMDSANDWIDIIGRPNPISEFRPWNFTEIKVPPSCCDSTRSALCSAQLLDFLTGQLNQMEQHILTDQLPIFSKGCSVQIPKYVVEKIQYSYWMRLVVSILLRLIQIPICFAIFYKTHPIKRELLKSKSKRSQIDDDDNDKDDNHRDDDNGSDYSGDSYADSDYFNPNNVDLFDQFRSKQYYFFRDSTSYISNTRLLAIFKSFPAFAQPSMLQLAFAKLKSKWLEKDMRIGWTFKHKPTHSYTSFIQQLEWNSQNETDRTDLDKLRQTFRHNLPALEVLCFADGNFDEKVESNRLYYGLISMLFRGIVFCLFSILSAQILLWTFLETQDTESKSPGVGKTKGDAGLDDDMDDEKLEQERELLVQNVGWMAQMFVRVSVIMAASLSKRFRCLLLLLVPSLGLAVGQSYLAAELIHAIMIGPGTTIQYNLEASAKSLICLMELASNMTRDAKAFLQDTQVSFGNGSQTSFLNVVKDQNRKLLNTLKGYGSKLDKITEKLNKTRQMAEKAEALLRHKNDDNYGSEENEARGELANNFIDLTRSLNNKAAEGFEIQMAESEAFAQKMLKNVKNSSSELQNMTRKIAEGFQIENNIRRQMTASCMAFQQTRQVICHSLANTACYYLQVTLSLALTFPMLVHRPCVRRNIGSGECSVDKIFQQGKRECVQSSSDRGVGWLFLQARDTFKIFEDAFQLKMGSFGLNLNRMFDWVSDRKAMVVSIAAQTSSMIKGLFRLSLVLSQFVKLLCLLVFFKAHSYINKYLTDPDFDNIYIGTTFENIDARRFRQNREVLLPLKADERKKVIWRTKRYTSTETVRAMTSLIKAIGVGLCLSLIFLIDVYIAELIGLLDEVTKIKIKIGDGSATGNQPPTIQVTGKGVLTNMIDGFIQIVQRISELDLEYDLSACSPHTQQTSSLHRTHFLTIWIIMLVTALLSGYLLRLRHMILDFFYPQRMKHRMVHLYNCLLTDRRRKLTISRNLLVNKSRVDQLQELALERSKRSVIYSISPQLAKRIGMAKMRCILCLEKVKLGPSVFHCPYDETTTCRSCLDTFFDGNEICVICLDRDPVILFDKDQELQKYKFLFGYNKLSERVEF